MYLSALRGLFFNTPLYRSPEDHQYYMDKQKIKQQIFSRLMETLDEKIAIAKREIESATESRNSDTKSSAGDKFETGREMAQMELNKSEALLARTRKLKKELSLIKLDKKFEKIEFGSLVLTNQENYFISFGMGKITIENIDYYAISLASPIGQTLRHKAIGDIVAFQGRKILVDGIF